MTSGCEKKGPRGNAQQLAAFTNAGKAGGILSIAMQVLELAKLNRCKHVKPGSAMHGNIRQEVVIAGRSQTISSKVIIQ